MIFSILELTCVPPTPLFFAIVTPDPYPHAVASLGPLTNLHNEQPSLLYS